MIENITNNNFQSHINGDNCSVVEFYSKGCKACIPVARMLEELSAKHDESKVKIFKCDVEETPSIPSKYNVMGLPTIIVFRRGKPFKQLVGSLNRIRLEELFNI